MVERREFMTRCMAAAMAGSGTVFAGAAAASQQFTGLLGEGHVGGIKAALTAAVGEPFDCTDASGKDYRLVLTQVTDGPVVGGIDQFRAVFTAPAEIGDRLPSDLYVLRNRAAGVFLLHLEAPVSELPRYVAQFGLLT